MNTADCTAIIPIKIDSEQRLINIQTTVAFLLKFFDFKIIVKEVDDSQKVFLDDNERLTYIFEKNTNDYFHRTKILNDMLLNVKTKYTINYDCDILLSQENCYKALSLLESGYDFVFPYKKGGFLGTWSFLENDIKSILQSENTVWLHNTINKFCLSATQPGLTVFKNLNLGNIYTAGGIQFFNTKSYIEGFGENEEFIDWGPEDQERLYRFMILGYKVGWIDHGLVCHMNHPPSKSTDMSYVYNKKNHELYDWITSNLKTKEQLFDYMNSLHYTKRLKENL
jgi:predicted glycosyltransferase involved in capsule biosynthesis